MGTSPHTERNPGTPSRQLYRGPRGACDALVGQARNRLSRVGCTQLWELGDVPARGSSEPHPLPCNRWCREGCTRAPLALPAET